MKFSSEDVAQQRFETRFRGYDPEQVREFLVTVAGELSELVNENRRLNAENGELTTELAEYRRRERSLHDALEMARDTANEIRERASREADLVVADAELTAERRIARADRRVEATADELERLKEQRRRVVAELRATLEMHLHLLDSQREPEYLSEAEVDLPDEPSDSEEPHDTVPPVA